jgi:hypothetical protein
MRYMSLLRWRGAMEIWVNQKLPHDSHQLHSSSVENKYRLRR